VVVRDCRDHETREGVIAWAGGVIHADQQVLSEVDEVQIKESVVVLIMCGTPVLEYKNSYSS